MSVRAQPQSNTLFSGGKNCADDKYEPVQLRLQPGICHRHCAAGNNHEQRASPRDNPFTAYSPELSSIFKATVTQHLLQGAGIWINKRFMYQAINDRRITDSSFRQQILYTVNQVESIYWGLVSAYEDVQAKQRALDSEHEALMRIRTSSSRSAPWRRWMWCRPIRRWQPTSRL